MSEIAKTLVFVAAGVVAVSAAWFFNAAEQEIDRDEYVGQMLFPEVDVAAPRRLQIFKFDRQTAEVRRFEVAEVDGVWSIPSKDNYPADATQRMADAVTCLMDRKILRVAGERESHESLGVVDPRLPTLDSKSAGVGTRVVMSDADDEVLVDVIIGKRVKDNPDQRYVRKGNQDAVYVVQLNSDPLTTSFADWIEDDLLKLNVMDLRHVFINDYSADLSIAMTPQGQLRPQITRERRSEINLERDADASPWQAVAMLKFDDGARDMVEDQLAEDEEIDQEAITKLITGLDDLLIVDVARKPEGLSADLKAGGNFLTNDEAAQDLASKGFIPVALETGADILSSEGEVVCTLANGVEYVLRFGQLQVQTESASESGQEDDAEAEASADAEAETAADATEDPNADAEGGQDDAAKDDAAKDDAAKDDAAKDDAEDADGQNLRRYLFVMARFDEDAVKRPELKDLPPLPDDEAAEETAADGEASADDAADDESTEESTGDASNDGESTDGESDAAAEDDAADGEAEDDASAEEQAKQDREAIMAERKAIEEENQRLEDEYQSTLDSGRQEVAKLNARFGDWYFVISNDVYKQIHLGRGQVVKKKETPAAEGDESAEAGASLDATAPLPAAPDATEAEADAE